MFKRLLAKRRSGVLLSPEAREMATDDGAIHEVQKAVSRFGVTTVIAGSKGRVYTSSPMPTNPDRLVELAERHLEELQK